MKKDKRMDDDELEVDPVATEPEPDEDLTSEMEFSLLVREVPVKINDPITNSRRNLILREMDGTQRGLWQETMRQATVFGKGGDVVGVRSIRGMDIGLIARCLFDPEADGGKGAFISEKEMASWPGHVIEALADRCRKICGLDKKAEKRAKNS